MCMQNTGVIEMESEEIRKAQPLPIYLQLVLNQLEGRENAEEDMELCNYLIGNVGIWFPEKSKGEEK